MKYFLILLLAVWVPAYSTDNDLVSQFTQQGHENNRGTMMYNLFEPKNSSPGDDAALILTLHGYGDGSTVQGPITIHPLAVIWARDSVQSRQPCYIVSPQVSFGDRWVDVPWENGSYSLDDTPLSAALETALEIVDSLVDAKGINRKKIFVTGLSMGGFGSWDCIMRRPDFFAAAMPMCGSADPGRAKSIAHIPIWTTHGTADGTIPVRGTRDIIEALENQGVSVLYTRCKNGQNCDGLSDDSIYTAITAGRTHVYEEYDGVGHVGAWRDNGKGYDNPLLLTWFFQRIADINATSSHEQQGKYHRTMSPAQTAPYQLRVTRHTASAESFLLTGRILSPNTGLGANGKQGEWMPRITTGKPGTALPGTGNEGR